MFVMQTLFKIIAIILINMYRFLISPFFGSCCRFHPSCSQYALEAFSTLSPYKAFILSLKRLRRCYPYGDCGYDPLPNQKENL